MKEDNPVPVPGKCVIKPVFFEGHSVNCLIKPYINEGFVLIEALSKLFFPSLTIKELLNIFIENLEIPLYTLTKKEEWAFIKIYGLPSNHLKCNQAVSITYLRRCVHKIVSIIKSRESKRTAKFPQRGSASTPHESKTTSWKYTRRFSIFKSRLAFKSAKSKIHNNQLSSIPEDAVASLSLEDSVKVKAPTADKKNGAQRGSDAPRIDSALPCEESLSTSTEQSVSVPDSTNSLSSLASSHPSLTTLLQPSRKKQRLENTVSLLKRKVQNEII